MAPSITDDFTALFHDVLRAYFKAVGMKAFSMGIVFPPQVRVSFYCVCV